MPEKNQTVRILFLNFSTSVKSKQQNHTSQQGALFWLEAELLSRIAKPNQAQFPTKIFLEIGGIDLGSPSMLARRSTSELSELDTLRCKINIK